jgi:hypothetical protein
MAASEAVSARLTKSVGAPLTSMPRSRSLAVPVGPSGRARSRSSSAAAAPRADGAHGEVDVVAHRGAWPRT